MTAVNLANRTVVTPDEGGHSTCSESSETLIAQPDTQHCRIVEAIYATNKNATKVGYITVSRTRSSVDYWVAYLQPIPPGQTVNLLKNGRQLYMTDADVLFDNAGTGSVISINAPFLDITDL